MYDNDNKNSKKSKIARVLAEIKVIIRKNKDLGLSEELIRKQNASDCFILDYLRGENVEFESVEEVNQTVEDLRVILSEEIIRYKPEGQINKLPHCDYDPTKIKR